MDMMEKIIYLEGSIMTGYMGVLIMTFLPEKPVMITWKEAVELISYMEEMATTRF